MTQHARRSRADAKTVLRHGTTTAAAAKMALSSLSVWFGLACALVGYVVGTYSIHNNEDPRRTVEDGASHFINVVQASEEEDASEDGLAWEDALSVRDLRAIVAIVLVLIALTVAFETAKEYLEESVSEDQEIILEKFFGELTVLGFLSMLTFFITKTGVIGHISEQVFGNEEELLEYFEFVHFALFFIMVFFVIQVLTMIREASETEKAWDKMDEQIRHQRNHAATQSEHNVVAALQQRPWYSLLCSRFWSLTHESNRREEAVFRALRREFVLDRSLAEPFLPVAEDKQVEDSFNFGRYLGLAQIHILSHAVEVQKGTWVFFGVTATLFYGVAVVVHEKVEILGWIWVGIGWMVYLSNVVFAAHLVQLRNSFLPHSVLLSEHGSDEQTYFLESGGHAEHLPKWCTFDLQNFLEKRPILARLFVGGAPNRQQAHYWMDRDGPKFYLSILQVDLIFTGIYVGLLMLEFLPFAHHKESRLIFALYVVAAILPLFGILYNKRDLVALMAQVSSVGTYRKEQIIRDVLLQAKTARIVRTFIIVHRMRRVAAELGIPEVNEDMTGVHDLGSSSFSNLEIREVERSFLSFDTDNSGSISKDEFRGLLERLGAEIEEDKFDRLMNALDADGSGDVTKEEFVAWYEFYAEKDKISLKERAEDLFSMFDRNNSGEITLGEFKVRLDALNMGFTMDEIGAILHELDRDRSGSVSLEEFEDLLEKFYPEELREVE